MPELLTPENPLEELVCSTFLGAFRRLMDSEERHPDTDSSMACWGDLKAKPPSPGQPQRREYVGTLYVDLVE